MIKLIDLGWHGGAWTPREVWCYIMRAGVENDIKKQDSEVITEVWITRSLFWATNSIQPLVPGHNTLSAIGAEEENYDTLKRPVSCVHSVICTNQSLSEILIGASRP